MGGPFCSKHRLVDDVVVAGGVNDLLVVIFLVFNLW